MNAWLGQYQTERRRPAKFKRRDLLKKVSKAFSVSGCTRALSSPRNISL